MPRIPPDALDSVLYLYPSREAAEEGQRFGGSGFLVGMPSKRIPGKVHLYAVTNWHVACDAGCSVVRMMTPSGQTEIFDYGPDQWEFLAAYDIAVLPMPFRPGISFIQTRAFIGPEEVGRDEPQLGVGDDVFMIGRFVDHDGGIVNEPAARFGHISVLPAPIRQPNGTTTDSFCIDVHSRSGYSGSPVFVYRTHYSELARQAEPGVIQLPVGSSMLKFLGIHFGQFPELWEIGKKQTDREAEVRLFIEGEYVKGLSGMTCVLPAWAVMQVLNIQRLQAKRDRQDDEWAREAR